MKAPPLLFGGSSPVVMYLRHSIIVVFPDPFAPTIRVRGPSNLRVWSLPLSNERILFEVNQVSWGWERSLHTLRYQVDLKLTSCSDRNN